MFIKTCRAYIKKVGSLKEYVQIQPGALEESICYNLLNNSKLRATVTVEFCLTIVETINIFEVIFLVRFLDPNDN